MRTSLPMEMRAVVLDAPCDDLGEALHSLRVDIRPVPRPARGQVVVRIAAAPCNPSDLVMLQGSYGIQKTFPTVPGWEGAGTVVASGGGVFARFLEGKRVACAGQADRDGTWAEYYLAEAFACVPLRRDLDFEQGAMLIINPLTALLLFDRARRSHRAAVQTAGASQLGRMLVRLAAKAKYPLISVVRSPVHVQRLRDLGAESVLNSTAADFEAELARECKRLGATIAFDAVAGSMTGLLCAALPPHSAVVVYGGLSGRACSGLDPGDLIFEDKRVESFWLTDWIRRAGLVRIVRATTRAQALMAEGILHSDVRQEVGLAHARDALQAYQQHMSEGKVLIVPAHS